MPRILVFLVGAVGGMSPTLLRVAIDLVNQTATIDKFDRSFVIGVLLLASLGGIAALIYGEKDLKKVLYIGLGLPSLFVVGTNKALPPNDQIRKSEIFSIQHVFAAEKQLSGRRLRFALPSEIRGANPAVVFKVKDNESSQGIVDGQEVEVPDSARSIRVVSSVGESESTPLPSVFDTVVQARVTADKNPWYGFMYAIGAHSEAYRLTIQFQQPSLVRITAYGPVALGFSKAKGVIVFQSNGDVSSVKDGHLDVLRTISPSYKPIDFALGVVAGKEILVAATENRARAVYHYFDLDNDTHITSLNLWQPAGVAISSSRASVLVGDGKTGDILEFQVSGDTFSRSHPVATLPLGPAANGEVPRLGAMTLDDSGAHLFAAVEKDIYAIDLQPHGKPQLLVRSDFAVSALACDIESHFLYVTGGKSLARVSLAEGSKMQVLRSDFGDATGVAVDDKHGVWVADELKKLVEGPL